MKQLFTYAAIMLLINILLTACSKSNSDSVVPEQTNVYVFGDKESGGDNLGGYWKNGVFTPIDGATGIVYGYVSGNTLYAAGNYYNGGQQEYFGYWKNGSFTEFDSLRTSPVGYLGATPISISVSGGNIGVLAIKQIDVDNAIAYLPVYWKNGVEIDFTNGSAGVTANNIVVSGNDVYVSGNYHNDNNSVQVPKYWKNGVETILAAASDQATAGQIFVLGDDVYVAGSKGKYAGYWKNGVFTAVTDGSQSASAYLIYVSGSDVYVGGYGYGVIAQYWKNGTVAATFGAGMYMNDMYVSGSDVYISGQEGDYTAFYWKNGSPTYLTDGYTSLGYGGSIFVTNN
jgi:hypothetical protein